MATTALRADERYDESNQLTRFDQFIAAQHDDAIPLPAYVLAMLDAGGDYIVGRLGRDARREAERPSWLAVRYRRFEAFWGRPGDPLRGLAPESSAAPPDPPPGPFDADCQLVDRLSIWYGGQYRGSIIVNYRLALLGGLGALLGHTLGHAWEIVFGPIEIACFIAILSLYLVGRSPRPPYAGAARQLPRVARRWHQRWLEYRVLAERFRYAALLQPVTDSLVDAWKRLLGDQGPLSSWHERYFLWRLRASPPPALPEEVWYPRLVAIMRHQAWYHRQAGARRHNVVHRSHRAALWAFGLALALLAARVVLVVYENKTYHESAAGHQLLAWAAAMSFLGGWGTLLAAAIQGALSTTELSRLAATSQQMGEWIDELRQAIEARHATGATAADLRAEVETFCRLVT
jgi:hypothetical protein